MVEETRLSILPRWGWVFYGLRRQTNSNPSPKVRTFLPTSTQMLTKIINRKNEDTQTEILWSGLLSIRFPLFFFLFSFSFSLSFFLSEGKNKQTKHQPNRKRTEPVFPPVQRATRLHGSRRESQRSRGGCSRSCPTEPSEPEEGPGLLRALQRAWRPRSLRPALEGGVGCSGWV